jgi:predicted nucleotidyltransferase
VTVDYDAIPARLQVFKAALAAQPDNERVVREHILYGEAFAIEAAPMFELQRRVANEFDVDANQDVFLVGSAKLGFSVAPPKRFRPFGNESDIDLAIVSHDLYQTIWHEAHAYALTGAAWDRRAQFEKYLAWGWIRPDMMPVSAAFPLANRWWEFFRVVQLERVAGPYKVNAALYHDMSFLIENQKRAVATCRQEVVT